jgi:hypothetical protein
MRKYLFLVFVLLAWACQQEPKTSEQSVSMDTAREPMTLGNLTDKEIENYVFKRKAEQVFRVQAQELEVIKGAEGTTVEIPANTFVFEDGSPVKGEVEVKLREFYSKKDIILSGLATMSDGGLIESGGMVYLEAQSEGKKVRIPEGKSVQMQMPTQNTQASSREGMQIFTAENAANLPATNWKTITSEKESYKSRIWISNCTGRVIPRGYPEKPKPFEFPSFANPKPTAPEPNMHSMHTYRIKQAAADKLEKSVVIDTVSHKISYVKYASSLHTSLAPNFEISNYQYKDNRWNYQSASEKLDPVQAFVCYEGFRKPCHITQSSFGLKNSAIKKQYAKKMITVTEHHQDRPGNSNQHDHVWLGQKAENIRWFGTEKKGKYTLRWDKHEFVGYKAQDSLCLLTDTIKLAFSFVYNKGRGSTFRFIRQLQGKERYLISTRSGEDSYSTRKDQDTYGNLRAGDHLEIRIKDHKNVVYRFDEHWDEAIKNLTEQLAPGQLLEKQKSSRKFKYSEFKDRETPVFIWTAVIRLQKTKYFYATESEKLTETVEIQTVSQKKEMVDLEGYASEMKEYAETLKNWERDNKTALAQWQQKKDSAYQEWQGQMNTYENWHKQHITDSLADPKYYQDWAKQRAEAEQRRIAEEAKRREEAEKSRLVDNTINAYTMKVGKLGWINCDRFYNTPENQKMDFTVSTGDPMRLIFRDINAVMTSTVSEGKNVFANIPKNKEVIVFGAKKENGKLKVALKPTKTEGSLQEVSYEEVGSLEEMEAQLQALLQPQR